MNMEDFELEKLRNEIQQEKQMKEMLEQSAAELRATVEELEKRYDTIDNEGNEWKTRFETQQEMNEQLERQILMLQNKVQEAKTNLKDEDEAEKDTKEETDDGNADEKESQPSPASVSSKSKSRVTIVTGNSDTPFSDNTREQAKKETEKKANNDSTAIRGILKNKGIQVDSATSDKPVTKSKIKNKKKRPISAGHLEKQATKVIILTDRSSKRFIKIDPKIFLSHEVPTNPRRMHIPPTNRTAYTRRQAWASNAPQTTEGKNDKNEKVRIFGSTRQKNTSYKEKFIQSKLQRSMLEQNLEGPSASNARGGLMKSETLNKKPRDRKVANNEQSQKADVTEEPIGESFRKKQSNKIFTVKEFLAEKEHDVGNEKNKTKASATGKHTLKTPIKEQTSGKPPTETSVGRTSVNSINKSSETAKNAAIVRSVSDGKVEIKKVEKENVRKSKSEIIQVNRNEKLTKTPDKKQSKENDTKKEMTLVDIETSNSDQIKEADDTKLVSKFPRTIQVRTKPGSYLRAGKTPRDLKNFDDLSDPTSYHVRMLEKQRYVLTNQLKEIQDRLDHESQANPHMIRMLEKEKNVLHNQMRDLEWRLDQESKANAHMVQMLEREKHILQGQLRDLEWRLDQESKPNLRVVQSLEKRKNMLQNQLRDIEWRIDQESKAYHKANDERKSYALEINTTKGVINELVSKQKASGSREHLETIPGSRTPRAMGSRQTLSDASAVGDGSLRSILSAHSSTSSQGSNKRVQWSPHLTKSASEKSSRISLNDVDTPSPSDSPRRAKIKLRHTNYRSLRQLENEIREMGNIPEDRRILDPKRGPIQKTAAVKNLPSLEST